MQNKSVILCLALFMWLFTFTSCQKDNLAITDLGLIQETSQEIEEVEPVNSIDASESGDVLSNQNSLVQMISITLTTTPCANEGYAVTVSSADADLDDGTYTIRWYRNTEEALFAEGTTTIQCVCGAGFRVEVYDQLGDLSAEGSLDVPSC